MPKELDTLKFHFELGFCKDFWRGAPRIAAITLSVVSPQLLYLGLECWIMDAHRNVCCFSA